MNLRAQLLGSVALVCTLLAAGCGKSPKTGPTSAARVVLQTDWYAEAEQGGYYQALARDFYNDAGLDLKLHQGGPGSYPLQKVATGQADFGLGGSDDVILAIVQGMPLVIVSAQLQHVPLAVLLHEENPAKSFQDLDGKTIMAVPGTVWIGYLEARYGIHFNLIPMNFSLNQFMAAKNFVQQCYVTSEPFYVGQAGVKSKVLLVSDSGYESYRVVFTSRKFADEHPERVRAFVAASIKGWDDFMNGDPAPAKKLIAADNSQMSDAFMDFSREAMKHYALVSGHPEKGERIGLITRRRLQDQMNDLTRLRIMDHALPLDKIADFSFLPADLQPLVGN